MVTISLLIGTKVFHIHIKNYATCVMNNDNLINRVYRNMQAYWSSMLLSDYISLIQLLSVILIFTNYLTKYSIRYKFVSL